MRYFVLDFHSEIRALRIRFFSALIFVEMA